jgi:2-polyprenyl-6-methoxyphenol hydroxylase-like FAD-dependent oxidoreductase
MSTNWEYEVAVIGAGPSGLSLAIELGTRGIGCLIVERNDRVGHAPRAKTTNVRTRAHFRRWGIADRLAELSPFGVDYPSDVRFVTRLAGHELAHIENASNCAPARNDLYPEHGQWIPQYKLEQVLRERAATLPSIDMRFNTRFVSASQDAAGVGVVLRDLASGEDREIVVGYAVGADGARSAMRTLIGAEMQGRYGLSRNYNIVFRAPGLAAAHRHGKAVMYWQVNPAAPSVIGPMDAHDIWFFMPTRLPPDTIVTPDSAARLIHEATGLDFALDVLSTDEWVASSLIADRYRDGRLFLIGDACHLHPPFGGYGMNMGVADGVDLGWKLAASLQGWGGSTLLDSYEIERRQIHEQVIAEAAANHAVLSNDLWSDGLDADDAEGEARRRAVGETILAAKAREFHTLGTVLGLGIAQSPVLAIEQTAADQAGGEADARAYRPNSAPGHLAPHLWRANGRSLYDDFGPGLTLICRPSASDEVIAEVARDAAAIGIPLVILRLSTIEAGPLYPADLTLVRPDQIVAWRGSAYRPDVLNRSVGLAAGDDRPESVGEA